MLRYRTRDLTSLNYEVCDCGRTAVRMSRILGRSDDMLIIRGVNVFPSQIESVILELEEFEPHYLLIVDRVNNTDTLQVMVYMPNRPRLFAGLSSLFSRHDLNILAARAYVTEHNFILDTFIVQMPAQCLPHDYRRIQTRLEAALDDFVHDRKPPEIAQPAPPQSRRSRHLPIAPRINIYSEDDAGWYVLEIITFNRRYLLANIAEVLSDFDISVRYAKIATLDERVEDSFLIYAPTLEDTKQQLALKKALLAQISN